MNISVIAASHRENSESKRISDIKRIVKILIRNNESVYLLKNITSKKCMLKL